LNTSLKNAPLRSIIGVDDRYLASGTENTGLVRIGTNGTNMGTGFVVGDHVIATSAHNVYDDNGWKSSISVKLYSANGNPTGSTLTPVEAHVSAKYITDEDNDFDYALITVSQNLSGYTHFALGNSYNVNSNDYANIPIYVTSAKQFSGKLYTGEDRIWGSNNTSNLNYKCDTTSGNSGSPVYTVTKNYVNGIMKYTYTALGINGENTNVSTHNSGVLVTKYLNQFYLNNSNINY
jgi:V8-like Glu-specific endopeptidase